MPRRLRSELDADEDGVVAAKLAPAFVRQLSELVRLLEKLARLHGDLSA